MSPLNPIRVAAKFGAKSIQLLQAPQIWAPEIIIKCIHPNTQYSLPSLPANVQHAVNKATDIYKLDPRIGTRPVQIAIPDRDIVVAALVQLVVEIHPLESILPKMNVTM